MTTVLVACSVSLSMWPALIHLSLWLNKKKKNIVKTGLEDKKSRNVSTAHPVQFFALLGIFQRPWVCQGLWKIPKSAKNCTGWAVET